MTTFLRAFWPTLGLLAVNALIELVATPENPLKALLSYFIRYAVLGSFATVGFLAWRRLRRWERGMR